VRQWLNLASVCVFGDSNQVLVCRFNSLEVLSNIVVELAQTAAKRKVLEQAEDELVGVFFFLECFVVFVVLPDKRSPQLVRQLHLIEPLVHATLDSAISSADNSNLFKNVEERHVHLLAINLFVGAAFATLQAFQWFKRILDIFRAKQLLQEFLSVNESELLIESEFGNVDVLLKLDAPNLEIQLAFRYFADDTYHLKNRSSFSFECQPGRVLAISVLMWVKA
jgi:hypothetical protein